MSLASLSEDLILLILYELLLADITSVRQAVNDLLDADTPPGSFSAQSVATRLGIQWKTGNLNPILDWRLYLPQLITWLRLVKTGKLEVQYSGVVLALGLGAESLAVHVIALRHILAYDIPRPPGVSDIPGRRISPILSDCQLYSERSAPDNDLERHSYHNPKEYTLPSTAGDFISYLKRLETPTIWEVAVCNSESESLTHIPPLRLIVLAPAGVEMRVVGHDLSTGSVAYQTFSLAKQLQYPNLEPPCVTAQPSDVEMARIAWEDDEPDQPALWALPVVDFDDVLGLTIVGNCFEELAIYDHIGRPATYTCSVEPDHSVISGWSQDNLRLNEFWTTDWAWNWDMWAGVTPDFAWKLEHAYGFPGPVMGPQAYANDDVHDCQSVWVTSSL
ncbi:hypothetical protein DFH07DRAFT_939925 [Mycena maculata]|uniref:F-box domain-containing protein n=1 Tax=Mycena maculata TaxID=230809 RepID=A0AAD7JD37_9AGAR|nr:hypothetical protein DFH07DRAFT_939925 [Mycena maculata]